MTSSLTDPALLRSLVLGIFGGVGLALTTFYSRRGPLIYAVYAAVLASLTLLLTRFTPVSFSGRYAAALGGFAVAAAIHYVAVSIDANRARRRLGLTVGVPFIGDLWRIAVLLVLGGIASLGVAFISS